MISKLLLTIIVIVTVYFLFFKKSRLSSAKQKPAGKTSSMDSDNTMIECPVCGTYMTADEAYIKNGHYFCSKTCMEKG
jgi:uncharacterized protein